MKKEDRFGLKFTKKFIKVYGLTKVKCHAVMFQDKKRYRLQNWMKLTGGCCLTLNTLFKEFFFDKVYLQGKTLKDFGFLDVGALEFKPYSSSIISKAKVEEGEIIYDSLSKR